MINRVMLGFLLGILLSQFALGWLIIDIGQAVKSQPDYKPIIAEIKADLTHLTHPQTISRRTVDWILRQGEFKEVRK